MRRRFITRRQVGRSFAYYDGETKIVDAEIIARIEQLAIPPAWTDVQIAVSARAKVQATGRDSAGRKQMIYSAAFRARQEKLKYDRLLTFAAVLPAMRRQVERDLARRRFVRDKVAACVVRLMDETHFRIGNHHYARQHETYGITTLRSKHTDVRGDQVTFDFTGKSGQQQHRTVTDRQLARIIKQLDELPGYEIFRYVDADGRLHDLTSGDVNGYIKRHMGADYTAKDFRTWGATVQATALLAREPRPETETARKKAVVACVKEVARHLGNTPAVTRGSYIDPRIIDLYMNSDRLQKTYAKLQGQRVRRYQNADERLVSVLLGEAA